MGDSDCPFCPMVAALETAETYRSPSGAESTAYFQDMLRVARAVDRAFSPRKMNYELLGNSVEHLHWHVFPRYAGDPDPSRPTWLNAHDAMQLGDAEYAATIEAIRRHLG